MRDLPAVIAGSAFHPPVAPARAVPNLQDDPKQRGIGRVAVLALARVAEGGRVVGVEPSTTVGLLVDVLGPELADRPAAGARLDVVSKQLGHASVAITADVYGHPDDDALEEAARKMGTVLGEGGH